MKARRAYKKRHPNYKTKEEREEAMKANSKKYYAENQEKLRAYRKEYYKNIYRKILESKKGRKMRKYTRRNILPPLAIPAVAATLPPDVEARLAFLEKEHKELLIDFEEVLKENREMKNLVRWGML